MIFGSFLLNLRNRGEKERDGMIHASLWPHMMLRSCIYYTYMASRDAILLYAYIYHIYRNMASQEAVVLYTV